MFGKKKKSSNVMPSTNLIPFEWIKDGIVKIRSENEYFIAFKVKEAPNLFLKDDEDQFAFFLGLKEHFTSLNPGDKMQILVVARVLRVLPYIKKLQRIADKSKGRKKEIALSNIEFFLNMLKNRELIGRAIYLTTNVQLPTRLNSEDDTIGILKEIIPKKIKEVTEFTAQYGVKVEMLSTEEIIEYLYKEFNPSIARIPEVKTPKEVVFLTTLDEETYKKAKQAEKTKAKVIPNNKPEVEPAEKEGEDNGIKVY